jgi:hypothetical protein
MQHSIMQNSAVEYYRGNDICYVTLYNNGPMLQHLWYYKVLQDIIEHSGAHPKIADDGSCFEPNLSPVYMVRNSRTDWFTLSVWPSVCGWYAVEGFPFIPNTSSNSFMKRLTN